jgi:hypothetical protein
VAASGRELANRVRARAPRPTGQLPVIPEAATPGPSRPTWPQPAAAGRRRRRLIQLCSAPATLCHLAGGLGPGPLRPHEPRSLTRRDHPGWRTRALRIEPAALATSIGTLTTLDVDEGLPEALQQVVEAAKLLFDADGAGLMLVGKDELLTWASASDAQAERAEAVQAELGAGPA